MEEGESEVYGEMEASLGYVNSDLKMKQNFSIPTDTLRKIT